MFDTHIHRTTAAPAYPQTVHEHRAPTDESVRLLDEMEFKARERIIHAIRCDSNPFKFRCVVYNDLAAFRIVAHINFWLGESEYNFETELTRNSLHREGAITEIHAAIVNQLAKVFTISVAQEHFLK